MQCIIGTSTHSSVVHNIWTTGMSVEDYRRDWSAAAIPCAPQSSEQTHISHPHFATTCCNVLASFPVSWTSQTIFSQWAATTLLLWALRLFIECLFLSLCLKGTFRGGENSKQSSWIVGLHLRSFKYTWAVANTVSSKKQPKAKGFSSPISEQVTLQR